jgi:hypothetical protein
MNNSSPGRPPRRSERWSDVSGSQLVEQLPVRQRDRLRPSYTLLNAAVQYNLPKKHKSDRDGGEGKSPILPGEPWWVRHLILAAPQCGKSMFDRVTRKIKLQLNRLASQHDQISSASRISSKLKSDTSSRLVIDSRLSIVRLAIAKWENEPWRAATFFSSQGQPTSLTASRAPAKELAGRSMNLVLVARSIDALQGLANSLGAQYGVRCVVLRADLAASDAVKRIVTEFTKPPAILTNKVSPWVAPEE